MTTATVDVDTGTYLYAGDAFLATVVVTVLEKTGTGTFMVETSYLEP